MRGINLEGVGLIMCMTAIAVAVGTCNKSEVYDGNLQGILKASSDARVSGDSVAVLDARKYLSRTFMNNFYYEGRTSLDHVYVIR